MSIEQVTRKLVLFDIDGTLLTSGGAGERALRIAFRERFGIDDDLKNVEIAGCTDSGIARRMLATHGLPGTPDNIAAPSSEEGGAAALSQPDVRPKGFEPLTF